jgi:hypothetical protein
MTATRRRKTERYREPRLKRALKRVEVQVPARETAVIRKAAEILRERPEEAAELRRHLGFKTKAGSPGMSALNIFAMPEPLSPEGEALWEEAMRQVAKDRKDPALNRLRDLDL